MNHSILTSSKQFFFSHYNEISLRLTPPAAKVKLQQSYIYLMEICCSGTLQLMLVGGIIPEVPIQIFLVNEAELLPDNNFLAHWKGESNPFSIPHCNVDCLDLVDLVPCNGLNTQDRQLKLGYFGKSPILKETESG